MEFYIGQVTSNSDDNNTGKLQAAFPKLFNNRPQEVTYTSPFCKVNAGGFIAIPEVGDEIIALYNPNPSSQERTLYYLSTVIKEDIVSDDRKIRDTFQALRSNDTKAQIYGESAKPVTQTFTNMAGAGLYIQREFTKSKISNNVTIKSETGEEVTVSPVGVMIKNCHGDAIILNGNEPNEAYGSRSLSISTYGAQEYKCARSDINMKILDGGDINIENNSTGFFSMGKWFGNIRLKSKFRNIDLVAGGPSGKVNIITPGATIQVDGTGAVKILAAGNIDFNTPLSINMNAGAGVNIYGGLLGVNLNSATTISNKAPLISNNGMPLTFTSAAEDLVETPVPPLVGVPSIPPIITPNDYLDPVGAV